MIRLGDEMNCCSNSHKIVNWVEAGNGTYKLKCFVCGKTLVCFPVDTRPVSFEPFYFDPLFMKRWYI